MKSLKVHAPFSSPELKDPRLVSEALLECIRTGATPITDGRAGVRVVRLLEAATQSLAAQGRPVPLSDVPAATRAPPSPSRTTSAATTAHGSTASTAAS